MFQHLYIVYQLRLLRLLRLCPCSQFTAASVPPSPVFLVHCGHDHRLYRETGKHKSCCRSTEACGVTARSVSHVYERPVARKSADNEGLL